MVAEGGAGRRVEQLDDRRRGARLVEAVDRLEKWKTRALAGLVVGYEPMAMTDILAVARTRLGG